VDWKKDKVRKACFAVKAARRERPDLWPLTSSRLGVRTCSESRCRTSRVKTPALPLSVCTSAPCHLCINCWPAAREGRDYTEKRKGEPPSPSISALAGTLHFLLWGISCAENERRKEKEKRGERHVNLPCVTSSSGGEGALFIDLSHTHVIKRNFSIGR